MPDQEHPRQIRVVFKKQVSDGNYGSESAEVALECWSTNSDEDSDNDAAANMLNDARILVHAELARSPNPRVRSALQLPLPTDEQPF